MVFEDLEYSPVGENITVLFNRITKKPVLVTANENIEYDTVAIATVPDLDISKCTYVESNHSCAEDVIDIHEDIVNLCYSDDDEMNLTTTNKLPLPSITSPSKSQPLTKLIEPQHDFSQKKFIKLSMDNACDEYLGKQANASRDVVAAERIKLNSLKADLLALQVMKKKSSTKPYIDEKIKMKRDEIDAKRAFICAMYADNQCVAPKDNNSVQMQAAPSLRHTIYNKQRQWIRGKNSNVAKGAIFDFSTELEKTLATCPPEKYLSSQPLEIKANLRDYQLYGLSWLKWCEQKFPYGGILADDMGVGKSLTILALICHTKNDYFHDDDADNSDYDFDYENNNNNSTDDDENSDYDINDANSNIQIDTFEVRQRLNGGTLIVCPSSVCSEWVQHIDHNIDRGSISYALLDQTSNKVLSEKDLACMNITITTYGYVVSHAQRKGPIHNINWKRVVLDEGHLIRNSKTKMFRACCKLRTKYRWVVTGTPIQNSEEDMHSLCMFLRFDPLNDATFFKEWYKSTHVSRLNSIMKVILLRRTKFELISKGLFMVNGIPLLDKIITNIFITLKPAERHCYNFIHDLSVDQSVSPFLILTRLRQMCCHPYLIKLSIKEDGENSGGKVKTAIDKLIYNKKTHDLFNTETISSKFQKVLQLIQRILQDSDGTDKIILVSEWTSALDVYANYLQKEEVKYVTFTGQMSSSHRQSIVNNFNTSDDANVMLLSLKAGAVGLNLQGANHIIFSEPHHNPQLDLQAEDRIHRLNQTKQCYIYRIFTKKTIEMRIKDIQDKKLEISHDFLQSSSEKKLKKKTVKYLLS